MKKRKVTALLAMLILGITTTMSGCGNAAAQQPTEKEELEAKAQSSTDIVSLKVWAEESQFELVQQMVDGFEANYAGQATFDITLEASQDGEARNVLLGDVHNGADVFFFPDDQLNTMVAGGALAEVNDTTIKNINLEESVNAATINGRLYAYPMTADNGYFLYYDKNYFSEEDVLTLDSILAICEENGKKFSMEFNSGWYLYSFFGNTGLEMGINDDGITNYCNWDSKDTPIKGVDVASALMDIASSPAFTAQPDADFVLGAQDGSVIAGISGTWNAMNIKNAWGADYGACKLPTYTCAGQQIQMASFTGYKMVGVNYYSENKDWAHKLAAWITNEECQTLRFEAQNSGPSNINAAASEAVSKVPAIAAVIEQSKYGVLQRVGNNYWAACTSFADTISAGNPEGTPLQDLIDKLVDGITAS